MKLAEITDGRDIGQVYDIGPDGEIGNGDRTAGVVDDEGVGAGGAGERIGAAAAVVDGVVTTGTDRLRPFRSPTGISVTGACWGMPCSGGSGGRAPHSSSFGSKGGSTRSMAKNPSELSHGPGRSI